MVEQVKLRQYSTAALADRFGTVKEERLELKGQEKGLREEILRREVTRGHGNQFSFVVEDKDKVFYDTNTMLEDMGAKWMKKYRRVTEYQEVAAKRLETKVVAKRVRRK